MYIFFSGELELHWYLVPNAAEPVLYSKAASGIGQVDLFFLSVVGLSGQLLFCL